MIKNLWDTAKADLREKFIAIQSTSQTRKISNPTLHLQELEKGEQTKPKVNRRKEIIKIRVEINEIENKKYISMKPRPDSFKR